MARRRIATAINKAIEAAAAAGGGTVEFPAGTGSPARIRLRSNITLHLERGAGHRSQRRRRPLTTRRSPTNGTSFRISATATFTTA